MNSLEHDQLLTLAVSTIQEHWPIQPRLGIVLGSGLGGFADEVDIDVHIPYADIPSFSQSTAAGHAGELVCGTMHGVPLVVLCGRFHFYEGYSQRQVTFPVRLVHALGIQELILSCAAGGLNIQFQAGDIMLISDVIDFQSRRGHRQKSELCTESDPGKRVDPHHWQTENDGTPRARGASSAMRSTPCPLTARMEAAAGRAAISVVRGVYAAVTGPNYETRAEQRFLRQVADAVGMSTVPELQVAAQLNLPAVSLALITNVCRPDATLATSAAEVLQVASESLPRFRKLLSEYIRSTSLSRL